MRWQPLDKARHVGCARSHICSSARCLCLVLHVTVEMEPLATIGSGSGKLRNPAS